MEEFDLNGRQYVELNNLLKLTGFCSSGGSAKMVISEGGVLVDGSVELRKRYKVRPGQIVSFGEEQVKVIG